MAETSQDAAVGPLSGAKRTSVQEGLRWA